MSIVRYKRGEVPPLTEEEKKRLKAVAEMPDSEIDYSDIPEMDDAFWARAIPCPLYQPAKVQTSITIDEDILTWLKKQGKGYHAHINAILREAMLRSL